MKQLGLLEGSNIFGDEVPEKQPDPYRTADGEIRALPSKAILWYVKEHGLTLWATGAWPTIYFVTEDDQQQGVTIGEIVEDYQARDHKNNRA
ncbi:hypothetical protein [Curtobacterium sp. MCSS17_007]|uniref:hypothetical protein n=1 Tax=Curtobacterium sp. MCSS17_007 TaxID=2175646 RepID=UPI000DA8A115|nr:hypothetical protein [Curtobacterium sp. MCSS17_007]WIE74512.1 hypothetical protein DEJ22_009475 [Curtobacterium sp. MCSS17_007]